MKHITDAYFKIALTFLHFLFLIPAVLGQDLILTTPLQTQCNQASVAAWDSITNYYYGVACTGFIGKDEWIGTCQAKFQWGGPWKPIDGYKHTLCGYLALKKNPAEKNNKAYNLISDGDGDLVFYTIPDPAFRWLQFKSLRPQVHHFKDFSLSCEVALKEPGNTIETDAATFIQSIPLGSLQYKPVGVYGPWVSDVYHQKSPEIHPVQQMWRMEQRQGDTTEYQLYSLFDNSSRFSDTNDFPDTCFLQPWMPVPLINVFYIPFVISINDQQQLLYDISMPSSNNINLYSASQNQLHLVVNGALRVTVNKPGNNFPSVTFMDVCQVNENTIHGYLAIETSIGKPGTNSGAHAILKVIRSKK